MKKFQVFSCVIFFSFFINNVFADVLTGRVVGVLDGDTITILDNSNTQYKIRLAGIDAPEKKQAFGKVSKQSLSDLVFGKQVEVDWQKQDRYSNDEVVEKFELARSAIKILGKFGIFLMPFNS